MKEFVGKKNSDYLYLSAGSLLPQIYIVLVYIS